MSGNVKTFAVEVILPDKKTRKWVGLGFSVVQGSASFGRRIKYGVEKMFGVGAKVASVREEQLKEGAYMFINSDFFQNGRDRALDELAPRLVRFGNAPKYRVGQRVEVVGDKGWSEESRIVDFRDGKYVVADSDGEKGLFMEEQIRPWR